MPPVDRKRARFVVLRVNHMNCGFFAQVQFILNELIAVKNHASAVPIVELGPYSVDGPNKYFDRGAGPNAWAYYFEAVAGSLEYDTALKLVRQHESTCLYTLLNAELWRLHYFEPLSFFTYPYGCMQGRELLPDWWEDNRRKARIAVSKYLRVKPHIRDKVESIAQALFGAKMLGVHIRGTDKGSALGVPKQLSRIVPPAEYFSRIDEYLYKHPNAGIFLATDQMQFRRVLKARYGERVVFYDAAAVSETMSNVFQTGDGTSNYKNGEDVLIDMLLLARCDFLLKCTSAVGEFALYLNPKLRAVDLNVSEGQCVPALPSCSDAASGPSGSVGESRVSHVFALQALRQPLIFHMLVASRLGGWAFRAKVALLRCACQRARLGWRNMFFS